MRSPVGGDRPELSVCSRASAALAADRVLRCPSQFKITAELVSPCGKLAGPYIELRSPFYACGYAVGASMAAVFWPPLAKEVTFAPRPRGIRVPGALVPPAVPNLTSVPPTCRWQTVWRQTGQGSSRLVRSPGTHLALTEPSRSFARAHANPTMTPHVHQPYGRFSNGNELCV